MHPRTSKNHVNLSRLAAISNCLIETENPVVARQAAIDLHRIFSGIVKLSEDHSSVDKSETALSEGTAISPSAAARCILDFMRTSNFLRGVRSAVLESRQRFPGQIVHVLYAGCGPFAPLVLPLTTQFGADQLQFTLVDIHKRSLDTVRQVVETLSVSSFVREYVQCDAATHLLTSITQPHIILIETMQSALEKEPQVAITRNLVPLLSNGGILIPERITLSAYLGNASEEVVGSATDSNGAINFEGRRRRINLGTIFEVTAESALLPWTRCPDTPHRDVLCSPPIRIRVPQIQTDYGDLMLTTNINVFGSIVLRDYECGLTYPKVLFDSGNIRSNDQFEARYVTGENPGLRWKNMERGALSQLY